MAEYYGVTRTPEYLMHYGVKGMRWGVRRALKSHSDRILQRQYSKAQKKLNKLSRNADVATQKRNEINYRGKAKKYMKIGGAGAGLAISALGGNLLAQKLRKGIYDKHRANIDNAQKTYDAKEAFMNSDAARKMTYEQISSNPNYSTSTSRLNELNNSIANSEATRDASLSRNSTIQKVTEGLVYGGAGAALAGAAGGAAYHIRANRARKRTTAEGHRKAVAERDAWKREMNKAFAGTKYASRPRQGKKRRR